MHRALIVAFDQSGVPLGHREYGGIPEPPLPLLGVLSAAHTSSVEVLPGALRELGCGLSFRQFESTGFLVVVMSPCHCGQALARMVHDILLLFCGSQCSRDTAARRWKALSSAFDSAFSEQSVCPPVWAITGSPEWTLASPRVVADVASCATKLCSSISKVLSPECKVSWCLVDTRTGCLCACANNWQDVVAPSEAMALQAALRRLPSEAMKEVSVFLKDGSRPGRVVVLELEGKVASVVIVGSGVPGDQGRAFGEAVRKTVEKSKWTVKTASKARGLLDAETVELPACLLVRTEPHMAHWWFGRPVTSSQESITLLLERTFGLLKTGKVSHMVVAMENGVELSCVAEKGSVVIAEGGKLDEVALRGLHDRLMRMAQQ